jgi:hypothetical protein
LYSDANTQSPFSAESISSIVTLPDKDVNASGQQLTINANATPTRRVVVHVTIPSESEVALMADGKLLRRGAVARGLFVRGREVVEGGNGGLRTSEKMAILKAMEVGTARGKTPSLDPNNVVPPSKGRPEHTVPWKVLRTYFIESANPVYSGSQPQNARAFVEVFVNQSGIVTKVETKSGDSGLADAASQALKQWRFRPFLVSGQAVSVRSTVLVSLVGSKIELGGN